VHLCATLPNLLPLEVQFGETDRFFTLVTGHDLRFDRGRATLPAAPGLGSAIDEAGARLTPWQPMPRPWLDPRLG
jgi:L-alanine-DL-glutamate epimerase-like enolase superfamily enzyme